MSEKCVLPAGAEIHVSSTSNASWLSSHHDLKLRHAAEKIVLLLRGWRR
jgi:hypothetical protein